MIALALGALLMLLWVLVPAPLRAPVPEAPRRERPHRAGPLEMAQLVEQLSTVLSSGAGPRQAWAALTTSLPAGDLQDLARAAAAGADLRRAAGEHLRGTDMVASLSTALHVCERTGAPMAVMLQHLAEALRDLHDAAQARRSAFAGPRSTARILLVLPLAGLGLGILLGGDPLRLLLTSGPGRLLGIAGLLLTGLGWWWMRRLLHRADPPARHQVDTSVQLELIAGALEAGLPLARAVAAVGMALPEGAEATALRRVATALEAGVPAALTGNALPAGLEPLSRSVALAAGTGADLSRVLRSAARDARRGRARAAEVLAAQLAVRLVLPTGLTLLPAFLALGIIPTVISLLGGTVGLEGGTG